MSIFSWRWITGLLAEALKGGSAADVVITGGPQISPSATVEDYPGQAGAAGMRRHLDAPSGNLNKEGI
jgi:hypothetical protein